MFGVDKVHLFSYAGDAHIKSKVKGIVCGIKDIQFVGELRVILSPLINTIPLFGAVTYFFLRKPVKRSENRFLSVNPPIVLEY